MKNKNKKEKCEQLNKKWKKFEDKLPKTQIRPRSSHKPYDVQDCMSIDEKSEFSKITKELRENCLDFLDPQDRSKIEERIQ